MKNKILIGIFALCLIIFGTGCSKSTTNQSNQSTKLGEATIPASGTTGIFKGKLETLVLTADDLPSAFKPYRDNTTSKAGYTKIDSYSATLGETQGYVTQQIDGGLSRFTIYMSLSTFQDTTMAAKRYNTDIRIAAVGLEADQTQGTIENIGEANYYKTYSDVNQYDPQYNSTTWNVYVLKSNLVIYFIIKTPASYTVSDIQSLLNIWQQKIPTYIPATDEEFQQENNSASLT